MVSTSASRLGIEVHPMSPLFSTKLHLLTCHDKLPHRPHCRSELLHRQVSRISDLSFSIPQMSYCSLTVKYVQLAVNSLCEIPK